MQDSTECLHLLVDDWLRHVDVTTERFSWKRKLMSKCLGVVASTVEDAEVEDGNIQTVCQNLAEILNDFTQQTDCHKVGRSTKFRFFFESVKSSVV